MKINTKCNEEFCEVCVHYDKCKHKTLNLLETTFTDLNIRD